MSYLAVPRSCFDFLRHPMPELCLCRCLHVDTSSAWLGPRPMVQRLRESPFRRRATNSEKDGVAALPSAGKAISKVSPPSDTTPEAVTDGDGGQADDEGGVPAWFVGGFVLLWAVGYSAIGGMEMLSGGMGDVGGKLGAAFGVVLALLVVGAAFYEVLR
eukprot:TRINITY_DN64058_c0_g1_i3.p1 TRINITY_DN64058_c0_g1~~TRINITY_DN64058_c0_g1_i3.p1  ORF type:complete len:159 (-),score=19.98 TRINITY_DN64058_c0_g1_i3:440-916(-)